MTYIMKRQKRKKRMILRNAKSYVNAQNVNIGRITKRLEYAGKKMRRSR